MHIDLPKDVAFIVRKLSAAGYGAYVVGGCVRDALLNMTPHDWDIASGAIPEEVKRVFDGYRILDTGIQHGTVTVLIDGEQYEVTTFREDGFYSDNRRPDTVEFVRDVSGDLSRRDLTINAMAYNPETGLVDLFDGARDLENRIVRCVGDADMRFHEDGLRILRAIRFASVLGFSIDADTGDSIHRNKHLLDNIASERIHVELNKTILGVGAARMLREYADVVAQVIPEIQPSIGFLQHNPHHAFTVWEHTERAVEAAPEDLTIRLTMLLHDIGKPEAFTMGEDGVGHFYGHPERSAVMAENILHRLKYDNQTTDAVVTLVRNHDVELTLSSKALRRRLHALGVERMYQLLAVKRADALAQAHPEEKLQMLAAIEAKLTGIIERQQCFSFHSLAVDGEDVMRLGVSEGERVGEILRFALEAVMDEKVENEKAAILALIRNTYRL